MRRFYIVEGCWLIVRALYCHLLPYNRVMYVPVTVAVTVTRCNHDMLPKQHPILYTSCVPCTMTYLKVWYVMLFWQHAMTTCLVTMHATTTAGPHMHNTGMQKCWSRDGDGGGGGRRGEAVQALGCCLKRLLSRLLKTQRPGLSVYLFHVNIQREPTVNSSIFLKTFCLAGSKLYLHEARHFEFGH